MAHYDVLQRFVFEHEPVRGEYVCLEATWSAVLARRNYPAPLAGLAWGDDGGGSIVVRHAKI